MNVIQTILDYNKSKESGGKTDITKSDIISALGYTPISELEKGANSGIAELDDNGKVLTSELPSYVDDVEEFNNLAELQKHTGEASKIYITLDDNKCYRWGGTAYVEISSSITLGETSGTAFRGDLGKEAYDKSHTHSNKEVIDSITSGDITNWNNKSDFDGKYTSLTDTPTIPTVTNDLTNELKANYDLASTQTHTHSNKELLDKLSLNKDNKLLYNGDKVDSDVDLTAIIDDSTITDKTTWSSNKINTTIPKTWVGTRTEYEQIKNTLENGTIVYITDDETVILYDKAEMEKIAAQVAEDRTAVETAKTVAETSATQAETAMQGADTARQQAVAAQNNAKISADIAAAAAQQTTADKTATAGYAQTAKTAADSTATDRQAVQTLTEQVTADKANVAENTAKVAEDRTAVENALSDFDQKLEDADEILTGVTDIKAYLGYVDEDIVGLCVDYKNKTFKRLAGAYGKTAGTDFDVFPMYGGRKRCNVSDDGTINAYYGDENYIEDGTNGQVMVYQPAFYYKVVPLEMDVQTDGIGYHLRKANYYVSTKAKTGFRLHPAFYDANGNELDYILIGAYEGSIYDTSASAYLLLDEQVMTVGEDKFCSIAGVKPASGLTQNLTRPNIETMAQNRGANWHLENSKIASMEQLLCMIEMGTMNFQTAIGQGVVSISGNSSYNCASLTGSTASLGNGTGRATETINEKGGVQTTETADGKTSVSYRGVENDWGNIWKFIIDPNIWGNGAMGGGEPFYCDDFNFAENKKTDNYKGAGFTVTNAGGYISAMGYSTVCDWLFMASECLGNSSVPVGDYHWVTQNLNGYRIARLGGCWSDGSDAGGFCWYLTTGVGDRYRDFGGRLVYVPTATA